MRRSILSLCLVFLVCSITNLNGGDKEVERFFSILARRFDELKPGDWAKYIVDGEEVSLIYVGKRKIKNELARGFELHRDGRILQLWFFRLDDVIRGKKEPFPDYVLVRVDNGKVFCFNKYTLHFIYDMLHRNILFTPLYFLIHRDNFDNLKDVSSIYVKRDLGNRKIRGVKFFYHSQNGPRSYAIVSIDRIPFGIVEVGLSTGEMFTNIVEWGRGEKPLISPGEVNKCSLSK